MFGTYTHRTRQRKYPTVSLSEAGVRDIQREALRRAQVMADLWFTPGNANDASDEQVTHESNIGNNGLGEAQEVVLTLRVTNGDEPYLEPIEIGTVPGNSSNVMFQVTLPRSHPQLSGRITWRDGTGPDQSVDLPRVFPPLPRTTWN